ncbi:MAG: aminotransferase class V-fold PLP-dependent enzyme [Bacteroidales bacterium]|nr:aminotransferase class V-fold PLP-dependent enzyme [Bacteroidales bacterium]
MERYFKRFGDQVIGNDATFVTPYGRQRLLYADWIASGRLYRPIEQKISETIGPWVGNTHTESSETGTLMTKAYHHAHRMIKQHVNAGPNDVIITAGFGMTAVINKLQRLLGLRSCGMVTGKECLKKSDRPVVFLTHMEHHSNHTSWFETVADIVVLPPDDDLLVDPQALYAALEEYKERNFKIGSFTACSNVTGVRTPYHTLAKIMHEHGGVCFIDFAASAPYESIDMHPADAMEKLDAVLFSPHKFLGGPGSSGVLVFDKSLYSNKVPDNPGGGTVDWTNPWGEYKYIDDIELREDGGTPGFLQAMRTAMAIALKKEMDVMKIKKREEELVEMAFKGLRLVPKVKILADNIEERLGVFSFYIEKLHYNLLVKLLNDKYGIQVRGGCACAGTYGHYLLDVSYEQSKAITEKITSGDLSEKPGWVRLSLHPTMTDNELQFILNAVEEIAKNYHRWQDDYRYDKTVNEFFHRHDNLIHDHTVEAWFSNK